jgi:hypothetical protein
VGYVTAQEVIDYTGVDYTALDLADNAALLERLGQWSNMATEMVNNHIGTTFEDVEDVPLGVANGTLRIVANMVAQAKLRRQTSIISIDEYQQRLVPDTVFTRSIKEDLEPYVVAAQKSPVPFASGNVTIFGSNTPMKAPLLELSVEAVNYYRPLTERMRTMVPNVWDVPND